MIKDPPKDFFKTSEVSERSQVSQRQHQVGKLFFGQLTRSFDTLYFEVSSRPHDGEALRLGTSRPRAPSSLRTDSQGV